SSVSFTLSLHDALPILEGKPVTVSGSGNGPIDAFVTALNQAFDTEIDVVDYAEHAMGAGKDATAVAYVESRSGDGDVRWGVGVRSEEHTSELQSLTNIV